MKTYIAIVTAVVLGIYIGHLQSEREIFRTYLAMDKDHCRRKKTKRRNCAGYSDIYGREGTE